MQPAGGRGADKSAHAKSKQRKRERRRQRKSQPGCEGSPQAGAFKTNRDADLAASGSREKLAKRYQVCIAPLVKPFSSDYILVMKISQVRNRSAKGGKTEAQGHTEDFKERAFGDS